MSNEKIQKWRRRFIKLLIVTLVFVAIFIVATVIQDTSIIEQWAEDYGYAALLIMSILSGFNLAVPIPLILFLPVFTALGLGVIPSVIIIAIGMTLGDSIGFFVGDAGRKFVKVEHEKSMKRLVKLQERHYYLPLVVLGFYATFAPAPNELIVIPLAFLGYKLKVILPIVFIGNLIFNALAAATVLGVFSNFIAV